MKTFRLVLILITVSVAGSAFAQSAENSGSIKLLDVKLPSSADDSKKPNADSPPAPAVKAPVTPESSKPAEALSATSEKPLAKTQNVNKKQQELKRIENYLNSITTIVADFTQVAPDGSLASGKFYLKRPGQMRWQYAPPTPVLIILDGWHFTYYDYELEQVSQLPVESSLAAILARKKIDLNDPKLVIEKLETSPGAARLQLYQKGKKQEGTLLLEMSDQPLKIRNIVVTDAQGQTTTISLNKARFGVPLERTLFKWSDPRKKRK